MALSVRIPRRRFLRIAVGGLAGAIAAPWVIRARAQSRGKVIVASGSGSYQKAQIDAYFTPFTQETGIEVEAKSVLSLAQKKAMLETGGATVDIFGHALADVILMSKNGWLEPIDYGAYRKEDIEGIAPEDRVEHGMGFIYWSEVMAYRTDVFPTGKHPRDWTEFWDTKRFPGPRSFGDPGYTYSIEFAALADGVPVDKLYPLDVDRALRSLSKIRKDVVSWWGKSAAQPAQQINDKEAVLCSVANGRVQEVLDSGAPVAIEWAQCMLYHTFYSVAKGAPNKENAMKLLAFIARPEPQVAMAKLIPYGPTNTNAYKLMDEKLARSLPTFPKYREKSFLKNEDWWFATAPNGKTNREIVIEKWEEWKLKG